MKNVWQDALADQALDIRAARALCRDGWSCKEINDVLKNACITEQQFETIQSQSRELDKLQQVFGPPVESLTVDRTESAHSKLGFLNCGPDAAAAILRDQGWNRHEISLVIQQAMFETLEETTVTATDPQAQVYNSPPTAAPMPMAFPAQSQTYAFDHPNTGMAGAMPVYYSQALPRRTSKSSLSRDAFILTFMAGFALVLVFTLL